METIVHQTATEKNSSPIFFKTQNARLRSSLFCRETFCCFQVQCYHKVNQVDEQHHKTSTWPGPASLRLLPLFNIYITKLTRPFKMTQRVFPQSSARSSVCGYFFSLPDQLNAYPADKNVFAPLQKKRSHKKGFCQL